MKNLFSTALLTGVILAGGVIGPEATEAKSVSATQQVNHSLYRDTFANGRPDCSVEALSRPNVTVTYAADVFRAADGTKLVDGSPVQQGSEIILRFKPFEYTDIYWFGTGYMYDSPYGEWGSATSKPTYTCETKDIVSTLCGDEACTDADREKFNIHVPFHVVRPATEIVPGSGLTCGALVAGEMRCTVTAAAGGTIAPVFKYAQTTGKFYFRTSEVEYKSSRGSQNTSSPVVYCDIPPGDEPLCRVNDGTSPGTSNSKPASRYAHPIPATQIPFTFSVAAAPSTILPTPTVNVSVAACGAYNVTVSGSDPSGERIRYGFDWNNNGIVDEWLPSTGYVTSGTSLTRVMDWGDTDTQFVKVYMQNERGNVSEWFSQTTNIDDTAYCSTLSVDLRATPSTIPSGGNSTLSWTTTGNPTQCVASGGWTGTKSPSSGSTAVSPSVSTIYTLTCTDGTRTDSDDAQVTVSSCQPKPRDEWSCTNATTYDNGCGQSACASGFICSTDPTTNICVRPSGTHSIEAEPALVRVGDRSVITWEAPVECTVTGNGQTWTGASGSETTAVITAQTPYTLRCPGLEDKTVEVRVIPTYQEI